jgi:tetratricopeptide (TPR) repeat protein
LNNRGNALAKIIEQNPTTIPAAVKEFSNDGSGGTNINLDANYHDLYFSNTILIADNSQSKYYQALKYYDTALSIDPTATDILNNKGYVLMKLGKYDEAIKVFDKILAINPHNVDALYRKGVSLDYMGKHVDGKQYQDKALSINPSYSLVDANRLYNRISTSTSVGQDITSKAAI